MSKKLVTYFSAIGVTEAVARKLTEAGNADLYEIAPEVPYTREDLDWTDKNSRSTIEMQDSSSRPAIADRDANVSDYDVILIGFPIWWYTVPTIINTFLEAYDFSGKTIVPFATSGGSGIKKAAEAIRKAVPDAEVEEGRLLNGCLNQEDLESWMEQY